MVAASTGGAGVVTALAPSAFAVSMVDQYVGKATATLTVRVSANASAATVGRIAAGTRITAWVPVTGWYQIISGPYTGKFVSRGAVTTLSKTSVPLSSVTAALAGQGTTTTTPSTSSTPTSSQPAASQTPRLSRPRLNPRPRPP